jgi:hypothetical protein
MRRRWPVAAVVVAALALAGCGDGEPQPAPRTPAPAVTSAAAAGTAKAGDAPRTTEPAGFVAVVREKLPEIAADRRDEEIQAIADDACAGLAAGKKADDIVATTRSLGTLDAEATDQATARELIKLAIDTTCLGQRDRVDEF